MKVPNLILCAFLLSPIISQAQAEWNKVLEVRHDESGNEVISYSKLSGIGAVINKENGKCVIKEVIRNLGADEAGLKAEDLITHVDSKDISSLNIQEIASLLRGNPETTVMLTVNRPGEAKAQTFTVVRKPIRLPDSSGAENAPLPPQQEPTQKAP